LALQRFRESCYPRLLAGLVWCHGVQLVLSKSTVFEHHHHIVIARNQPGLLFIRQSDTTNRLLGAQACVEWEWIGFELAADDID
jgi:hypothetical protein